MAIFKPETYMAKQQAELQEKQFDESTSPYNTFLKTFGNPGTQQLLNTLGSLAVDQARFHLTGGKEQLEGQLKDVDTKRMTYELSKDQQDINLGLAVPSLREEKFNTKGVERTPTGDYFTDQANSGLPSVPTATELEAAKAAATVARDKSAETLMKESESRFKALETRFLSYGGAATESDVNKAVADLGKYRARLIEVYGERHPELVKRIVGELDTVITTKGVNVDSVKKLRQVVASGKAGQLASNVKGDAFRARGERDERRQEAVFKRQKALNERKAQLKKDRDNLIGAGILKEDGTLDSAAPINEAQGKLVTAYIRSNEEIAKAQKRIVATASKTLGGEAFDIETDAFGNQTVVVSGVPGQEEVAKSVYTAEAGKELVLNAPTPGPQLAIVDVVSDKLALQILKANTPEGSGYKGKPYTESNAKEALNSLIDAAHKNDATGDPKFQSMLNSLVEGSSDHYAKLYGTGEGVAKDVNEDKLNEALGSEQMRNALINKYAQDNTLTQDAARAALGSNFELLRSQMSVFITPGAGDLGRNYKERTQDAVTAVNAFRTAAEQEELPVDQEGYLTGLGFSKTQANQILNEDTIAAVTNAKAIELFDGLAPDHPLRQVGATELDSGSYDVSGLFNPTELTKFNAAGKAEKEKMLIRALLEK